MVPKVVLVVVTFQLLVMLSACRESSCGSVRESILAGSWYPGSRAALEAQVDGFFAAAKVKELPGKVVGIVSPHAGYRYSGQCAAYGYKALKPGDCDVVVVMAPSHRMAFRGASVLDVDAYKTPLGLVPTDREACESLRKSPLFSNVPQAHAMEHSLEIQLPFLQRRLGEFKLVPIVIGRFGTGDFPTAATAIRDSVAGRRALFVASSDFTHYGARFGYRPFTDDVQERLKKLDMGAVDYILAKDMGGFVDYKERTGITCCGWQPIATLIAISEDTWRPELLHYYTSGQMTGDWDSSVSYVSLVFTTPAEAAQAPAQDEGLTKQEQQTLLRLARETLESYVRHGKEPEVDPKKLGLTPRLVEKCGVFVTLKSRGRLRGCIGHIVGRLPLYQGVIVNAVNSAARDSRFSPVKPEELEDIEVEVSVLTPFREVSGPEGFVPGKHGIYIKKGRHSAVYLPQVAADQGWDRAETLTHLCQKAGLSRDEWQRPGMEFFVCTGQAFGEGGH